MIHVPSALSEQGIDIRLQQEADLPFIRDIYVSHRWEETANAMGWTESQRLDFLHQQFSFQWRHYSEHYYDAEFMIVQALGVPIGRLYLFHNHPQDLRIVEIGFMPAWRGRGIGTMLLRQVQDLARGQGKFCSIHVEQTNPARNLYKRLGFQEIKPVGPYLLLHWSAE